MAGDLLGRLHAAVGELADLARDHGEAAAVLAGARRFDRRVERQQVRLLGDAVDDLDDVADLIGVRAEPPDVAAELGDRRADRRHRVDDRVDRRAAALGGLRRLRSRSSAASRPAPRPLRSRPTSSDTLSAVSSSERVCCSAEPASSPIASVIARTLSERALDDLRLLDDAVLELLLCDRAALDHGERRGGGRLQLAAGASPGAAPPRAACRRNRASRRSACSARRASSTSGPSVTARSLVRSPPATVTDAGSSARSALRPSAGAGVSAKPIVLRSARAARSRGGTAPAARPPSAPDAGRRTAQAPIAARRPAGGTHQPDRDDGPAEREPQARQRRQRDGARSSGGADGDESAPESVPTSPSSKRQRRSPCDTAAQSVLLEHRTIARTIESRSVRLPYSGEGWPFRPSGSRGCAARRSRRSASTCCRCRRPSSSSTSRSARCSSA